MTSKEIRFAITVTLLLALSAILFVVIGIRNEFSKADFSITDPQPPSSVTTGVCPYKPFSVSALLKTQQAPTVIAIHNTLWVDGVDGSVGHPYTGITGWDDLVINRRRDEDVVYTQTLTMPDVPYGMYELRSAAVTPRGNVTLVYWNLEVGNTC